MHHFQCPAKKNSAENHCGFWLSFEGKLLLSADITVLLSSFWCINSKKHVPEWPGWLKPEESLDLFIFLLLKKHSMGKGCETKGYGGDVHYPTNDLTFIFFKDKWWSRFKNVSLKIIFNFFYCRFFQQYTSQIWDERCESHSLKKYYIVVFFVITINYIVQTQAQVSSFTIFKVTVVYIFKFNSYIMLL